jgi:hypothetical protein
VAKLFAKHIKISEAIEMCKTTKYVLVSALYTSKAYTQKRMTFGVGTPKRIADLLDDGKHNETYCILLLTVHRSPFYEALETNRN